MLLGHSWRLKRESRYTIRGSRELSPEIDIPHIHPVTLLNETRTYTLGPPENIDGGSTIGIQQCTYSELQLCFLHMNRISLMLKTLGPVFRVILGCTLGPSSSTMFPKSV